MVAKQWRLSTWDIVAIAAFVLLLLVRIWRLKDVPSNVTGDDVTDLSDIVRIIYFPDQVGLFSLLGDGSKPAINFYFMSWFVNMLPVPDAVLGMRLASSVLSLGVLGAFYLYLRTKVASGPALLATVLLGTNYIFLNFSRATWMAGGGKGIGLMFGFLSFILVERAVQKRHWYLALWAGICGGLSLYGYLGTMFFPAASLSYFAYSSLQGRLAWKSAVAQAAVFAAAAFLVFLPQLLHITQHYERYTLRAKHTSINSVERPYYGQGDMAGIMWHQVVYTVRGFLLLDPDVGGEGVENRRYGPVDEALVDTATRVLFFLSVLSLFFFHQKDLVQPTVVFIATLLTTQLLSEFPPNFSRGLFALLFIYLLIAVFLDKLWSTKFWLPYGRVGQVALVVLISLWSIQHYFQWASSDELAEARQPAIKYEQVPLWIATQRHHIATGQYDLVITSEEWQQLIQGSSPGSR